jgi:hypothetical protein
MNLLRCLSAIFKACSAPLFYALLFFSSFVQVADDPAQLNRRVSDDDFAIMSMQYKVDLPHQEVSDNIVNRLRRDHPGLNLMLPFIKNPYLCQYGDYPSRLLFNGPSGSGKKTAARAIAKYANASCILLETSAFRHRYQGSLFINKLFDALLERPDQLFVVVIDGIVQVSQQERVAADLCCILDACENKKHICVIGTDNVGPSNLPIRLKIRFAYDTFTLAYPNPEDIVGLMKECLGYKQHDEVPHCSDAFLRQLAGSLQKIPLETIEDLIDESKALAIMETQNSDAFVTEQHLVKMFSEYREPTFCEKLCANRTKCWSIIRSPGTIATGMFVVGTGLFFYDRYKRNGFTLSTLASLLAGTAAALNYYHSPSRNNGDLLIFNVIDNLIAEQRE